MIYERGPQRHTVRRGVGECQMRYRHTLVSVHSARCRSTAISKSAELQTFPQHDISQTGAAQPYLFA